MRASQLLLLFPLAVVALSLAACSSGGGAISPTPSEEQEPQVRTVTSDDGKLTLEIPEGAVDEDVLISATAVPREELPEALSALRGAGTGYRLEPDGLEFSEPVDVALTLDAAELEGAPANGVAAFGLVTFDEASGRQILDGLLTEASLGSATVTARAKLSHFSFLGRTQGSLSVTMEQIDPQQAAGSQFQPAVSWANTDPSGTVMLEDAFVQFRSSGTVRVAGDVILSGMDLAPADEVEGGTVYECKPFTGPGTYGVSVHATSVVEVEGEILETVLRVTLGGSVECGQAAPDS